MKRLALHGLSAVLAGTLLFAGCGGSSSDGLSDGAGRVSAPSTAPKYLSDASAIGMGEGGGTSVPAPSGTARVRVYLTDAPKPSIDGAVVTISNVTVHKAGGAWFSVMDGSRTLDLLDLQNGVTELLGELALEAGNYTQIRFLVNQGTVQSGGMAFPMEVSSGNIKINRNIEVCGGGDITITVDFDAEKSLKYNPGKDNFKMQPVVKIAKVESECPEGETGGDPGSDTEGDADQEYDGPLGRFSLVLPPVNLENFSSLVALVDDLQVHDQGIGQVTTFQASYTADLLEGGRQVIDEATGEPLYTILIPSMEIPAGTLDQIRLLFQSIVATDLEGNTVTIMLPSDEETDGLKFFGAFDVCEGGLTTLFWDLDLSSMVLGVSGDETLFVHPEIHGPGLISVCEPYDAPTP